MRWTKSIVKSSITRLSLSSNSHKRNLSLIDSTRYAIQKTLLKLYLYLGEITGHGKKKLVQNKWASRTVFNATSNVITAPTPSGRFAEAPTNIGYKDNSGRSIPAIGFLFTFLYSRY